MSKKTSSPFPKSWRKWRQLKEGEALRYTDRILWGATSSQMGAVAKGQTVTRASLFKSCPEGWYYRKVS